MKIASKVLGIVGGALLLIISLIIVLASTIGLSSIPGGPDTNFGIITFAVWFGFGVIGGILSIIGGALVQRKNVLSAVFMFIGAGAGFITFFGILPAIAMLIGGIFALIKDRPPVQQPYAQPPQFDPPQTIAPPLDNTQQKGDTL